MRLGRCRFVIAAAVLAGASAQAGEIVSVKINDLAFEPRDVTVKRGDIVEWRNDDFVDHTATAGNGRFDVTLPAGTRKRLTIGRDTQSIEYFCRYHPGMVGSITVKDK